jgi:hypothetical protein
MPLHTIGEAELRERCRTLLEGLEVWLRRLIHDRLTEVYGPDYLTAKHGDGNNIIAGELRRRLSGRQAREPAHYARPIDAADLEDEVKILCNPNLYNQLFKDALADAFPVGREQAKVTLDRLLSPRNALSHGNPISVRQAEQVVCYTGDVIESLKRYYMNRNLGRQYNVPTVIRYSDSFGTSRHENEFRQEPGGPGFLLFDKDPTKHLRVGDILSMQVEIDPSFAPNDYEVRWEFLGAGQSLTGPKVTIEIQKRHVNERFEIQCYVTSKKDWHRFGGWDDFLAVTFKVLPPEQ